MIRAPNLSIRLANILAARGVIADGMRDVQCVDDSDGEPPRLAFWDEAKLGPAPTQVEVDAAPEVPTAECEDQRAALAVYARDRLLFEINFAQENRIRALEGSPAISRAQYRDALIAAWKTLTP